MEIRQAHAEAVAAKQAGDDQRALQQLRRRKQLQKHKEALLDMETLGEAAAEQLHEIGQLDSKALLQKTKEALASAEVSTQRHSHPPSWFSSSSSWSWSSSWHGCWPSALLLF